MKQEQTFDEMEEAWLNYRLQTGYLFRSGMVDETLFCSAASKCEGESSTQMLKKRRGER